MDEIIVNAAAPKLLVHEVDVHRMAKHRMKLDLNNLMSLIDETLSAEEIETVHNNAFCIATGLELLCGYLREIGQRAIDTNDEFLQKWCLDLHILKEGDDG